MFRFFKIFILCLLFIQAACADGPLRQAIKNHMIKKEEEKPAPEASGDVDKKLTQGGVNDFKFSFGGRDRYYRLYLPKNFSPEKSYPLVLCFHGGGGDMSVQSSEDHYHWISKADIESFVVAFPNGTSRFKSAKFATWNAGACCGVARDQKVNDIEFVKQILSHIRKQVNIDSHKIYAVGMSNGGMMSYRIACEIPEMFAAIASVAGTDNTLECKHSVPISTFHIHAKDDDHVLFNGGLGPKALDPNMETQFKSVGKTIEEWKKYNSCKDPAKKVLEKAGAYCEEYSDCSQSTRVKLCVTETGGHSWPGGSKAFGFGKGSTEISATDVIWDFFKDKSR